jgi:hypothetical protein
LGKELPSTGLDPILNTSELKKYLKMNGMILKKKLHCGKKMETLP